MVAVDVPIGLPSVEAWTRDADGSARQFLGVRRNSVFWTLPRLVLDQPSHQAAIKMCEAHGRAKVSAQAYALRERIFEAERVAELDGRVYEVHPEVCFCEMAGEPLPHSKRTWSGVMERLDLLERNGITVPSALGVAGAAAPDDVLDAAAAAWTAGRIANGAARSLPTLTTPSPAPAIWY